MIIGCNDLFGIKLIIYDPSQIQKLSEFVNREQSRKKDVKNF